MGGAISASTCRFARGSPTIVRNPFHLRGRRKFAAARRLQLCQSGGWLFTVKLYRFVRGLMFSIANLLKRPTLPQPEVNLEQSDRLQVHGKRIFISGTGRAGTTYLVRLLMKLGLDTGTWTDDEYFPDARAGLERHIFDLNAPRIVKSPFLCEQVDAVLAAGVAIDHVIIPIRRLEDAAASRILVQQATPGQNVKGGLWETEVAERQIDVLRRKLTSLIEALVRHDIPMTLISFPRSATDAAYLYRKLSPLIPSVEEAFFHRVFVEVSKPELIHDFSAANAIGELRNDT